MSLCFNVKHLLSEHVFTNDEYKKYLYMDSTRPVQNSLCLDIFCCCCLSELIYFPLWITF